MPRFRVSISGLSALILVAAILTAMARSPTEGWANASTALALLTAGLAGVGAATTRGAARAYWGGFALMAWGYLALAFGPWCDTRIAPLLITKTLGEWMHSRFRFELRVTPYARLIPGSDGRLTMYGYQQMGHSLASLLAGLLGGWVARWLARGGMAPMGIFRVGVAAALVAGLVGLAGLASAFPPDEWVANGTFCSALLILGLGWIAAGCSAGPTRAAWLGFAALGSGYLVLVYAPWFEGHTAQLLVTETALKALRDRYGPTPMLFTPPMSEQAMYGPRIFGHSLAALGAGLVGGASAGRLGLAAGKGGAGVASGDECG